MIIVHDGLDALKKADQNKICLDGMVVVESVDIDKCFAKIDPNGSRWDYYIGLLKQGAIYVEVHEISYDHLDKIFEKAKWLREKIAEYDWPEVDGRPLLIAPTKGISFAVAQDLHRRLAQEKIIAIMKGDLIFNVIA
ncbi:hypothetical protein JOD97_003846 [Duganella sp. 1411]|uniref:hypothetical protein n=1 Tax=Duganella sp. 1411 TaxID=2806572 RepID=UPI001AE5D27C|nr:hypothetical protein [Duganella sp. 1411]MBP1205784.1 hypothetical protein [Duganella sp. 1411]